MNKMGMCMNWKVVGGLVVVGLGIWAVAPSLAIAALPVLAVLACPLSMLFMMRGMGGSQCASSGSSTCQDANAERTPQERLTGLRAQRENLAREIAELEAAGGATHLRPDAGARVSQPRV